MEPGETPARGQAQVRPPPQQRLHVCLLTSANGPLVHALRVCHTACLGSDDDVLVFGGSSDMRILQDTVSEEGGTFRRSGINKGTLDACLMWDCLVFRWRS